MFALTDADLRSCRILGCADGPASFNAELTALGGRVVSVDPLYRFSVDDIRARIDATRDHLIVEARRNAHRFIWNRIHSPEELGRVRTAAMERFLVDFSTGSSEGRYMDQSLPELNFEREQFDIALCSHFLFLYSHHFSLDFHVRSIMELCRVATEVRIFPLLNMHGEPSQYLKPAIQQLAGMGISANVERVDYEFQCGGNQMLRVVRSVPSDLPPVSPSPRSA
jgi:hypothetical protein